MTTFEENMKAALRAYNVAETQAELAQESLENATTIQQELARVSDIADKKRHLAWLAHQSAVAEQKRAHILHREQVKAMFALDQDSDTPPADTAPPRPTLEELHAAYYATLNAWTANASKEMYYDAHHNATVALRARLAETSDRGRRSKNDGAKND
jgi:hypothetical protein